MKNHLIEIETIITAAHRVTVRVLVMVLKFRFYCFPFKLSSIESVKTRVTKMLLLLDLKPVTGMGQSWTPNVTGIRASGLYSEQSSSTECQCRYTVVAR